MELVPFRKIFILSKSNTLY